MKALPVLFCSLFMLATTAFATEAVVPEQVPYYKDYKRGWFWYEQQKAPENPKEEEQKHRVPSLSDYTVEQLWDMHPDDFQALLIDFQKKAVWRPTPENVEEYYYVQDIARRKALAFTNVAEYVMQKDPELSLSKDYPTVVPGQNALVRSREGEVKERITVSSTSTRPRASTARSKNRSCGSSKTGTAGRSSGSTSRWKGAWRTDSV